MGRIGSLVTGAVLGLLGAPYQVASQARGLGAVLLDSASALLAEGNEAGIPIYYRGAAYDDSASVTAYRSTLEPIWTDHEAALFDQVTGQARALFLLAFWARRTTALRDPGERLMEHHRRLAFAREHFALPPGPRKYYDWETFRSASTEYDDRGVIYVRHGTPGTVVQGHEGATGPRVFPGFVDAPRNPTIDVRRPLVGGRMGLGRGSIADQSFRVPFQAWRYGSGDSTWQVYFRACARSFTRGLFLFTPCGGQRDYRLVESALDLFSPEPMAVLASGRAIPIDEFDAIAIGEPRLVADRDTVAHGRGENYAGPMDVRQRGMDDQRTLVSTDSYGFVFDAPIEARIGHSAIGRVGPTAYLHLTFAARVGDLAPRDLGGGILVYVLKVRTVAYDSVGGVVGRRLVERVYQFDGQPDGDSYLLGVVSVPVQRQPARARVVLEQGTRAGAEARLDPVTVPALDSGPGVSDLILGLRATALRWIGSDTVWFNPSERMRLRDTLQVAWEVYGLPPETRYRADLQIRRDPGGGGVRGQGRGRNVLGLGFEELTRGYPHLVSRGVLVDELDPGPYIVELTVRLPDGKTFVRESRVRMEP